MICHKIYSLPDIDMYGGDTTPWDIVMVYEDGTNFVMNAGTDCRCTLTLSPFGIKTLVPNPSNSTSIIWSHQGTINNNTTTSGFTVRFDFNPEDTINLRGKFLYQVDMCFGDEVRIGQGVLNIRQNLNSL